MNFIFDTINKLPSWSIYIIFVTFVFIILKIYFKFYYKLLNELTNFTSIQTANEKLFLNKICGYFLLFLLFIIFYCLGTYFSILIPKLALFVIWLIALAYVKSSLNLFDHIISLKYTPHLLKELEYTSLCGEIITENGVYYVDTPFQPNKIKL